jgi:hypothetical protein
VILSKSDDVIDYNNKRLLFKAVFYYLVQNGVVEILYFFIKLRYCKVYKTSIATRMSISTKAWSLLSKTPLNKKERLLNSVPSRGL